MSNAPSHPLRRLAALVLIHSIFGPIHDGNFQLKQDSDQASPVEFGRQFASVCRVGKRGGDGTLIDAKWVLTAAHVARGMFRRSRGELSVFFEDKQYRVKHVFLHPLSRQNRSIDIALLEIEEPVADVNPFPIYRRRNELGKLIVLAGHGDKRDSNNNWIKDGKLRTYTNKIDRVTENKIIFDYDGPNEDPTRLEGTSGPGDSGGPALIKTNNQFYVAGVSSMGQPGRHGPATYGAIEHFVRVSTFQDWIDRTIENPDPKQALTIEDAESSGTGKSNSVTVRASGIEKKATSVQLSNSPAAETARRFIQSLENYAHADMEKTIRDCFAGKRLASATPQQIMQQTPVLFKQLQNAKLTRIVQESPAQIVVELKKQNRTFVLRLVFDKTEKDKIQQLIFGKLSN